MYLKEKNTQNFKNYSAMLIHRDYFIVFGLRINACTMLSRERFHHTWDNAYTVIYRVVAYTHRARSWLACVVLVT
jgi:hypothetical protein